MRAWWFIGAGLVSLGLASMAIASRRPDPLADEAGCRHYRGTSSGNDPSVQLDVVLCPHESGKAGAVQGKVQWSSLVSGWNLRAVEGAWALGTLTIRDAAILDEKPEPGYRFCTIDAYVLTEGQSGALSGKYESKACDDHATVELRPVPGETAPASDVSPPPTDAPRSGDGPRTHSPERAEPAEPPPRSEPPSGGAGCGCGIAPMLAFPLLAVRRRRRSLMALP